MDKQPVGQLPDLTQSNNDDEIMVITNDEYNQLKKEKIADFITDLTSTDENNAIVKGTDGKLFTKDFGNASNITEGTLPVSVLPDIPKDKLPEIETDDLPDSGITAGTYTYPTDIVVNSKGQVTSITEGQAGANNANQDLSNLGPLGLDKLNQSKALETGSVSSDADVFADIQKYAHSTFNKSKFTVVGSPTITDDGIASGFSDTNYVQKSLDLSSIKTSIKINASFIFDTSRNEGTIWNKDLNFDFRVSSSGNVILRTFNGSSAQNFTLSNAQTGLKTGDNVDSSVIVTENQAIIIINGKTYTKSMTTDLSNIAISSVIMKFGKGNIQELYYPNSIDLKSIAIWADGVPVFSGNKTGIDVIKPDNYEIVGSPTITSDGVASGFSLSNYLKTSTIDLSKPWKIKYKFTKEGDGIVFSFGISDRNYVFFANDITRIDIHELSISVSSNTALQNNATYFVEFSWDGSIYTLNVYNLDGSLYMTLSTNTATACANSAFTIGKSIWEGKYLHGSIDLNSFKIYVDGNLVYQPCLKIPYTLSKTGSKIVDAAYRDRVQDVYEQYGTAMYYTLDEENQNFTLPMGDIYGMIEKKNEELNNPFSLFDSKYSEAPLYNASWLLSNGTYYSKSVYVTAYEALVVENNSEIEAGTSVTLPSGGNYVKRGLSVKLSTAEDITDFDFVINTTDETFKLPLLNGSEINIDYSQGVPITSGYIAPCNGVVSGGNNSLRNTSAVLRINDEIVAYAWGGDVTQDGTNIYVKVSKGDEITFTNLNTVEASTRNPVTFFPAAGNGLLYFYVGETVQNANLIDAGRIAELFTTKQFATSASFPSDRYTNLSLGASNSNYTAPADGYFVFDKSSTSSNQYVALFNTTSGVRSSNMSAGGSNPMSIFVPAKKNDTVNVQYNAGGNVIDFKFVYAEGAKND